MVVLRSCKLGLSYPKRIRKGSQAHPYFSSFFGIFEKYRYWSYVFKKLIRKGTSAKIWKTTWLSMIYVRKINDKEEGYCLSNQNLFLLPYFIRKCIIVNLTNNFISVVEQQGSVSTVYRWL